MSKDKVTSAQLGEARDKTLVLAPLQAELHQALLADIAGEEIFVYTKRTGLHYNHLCRAIRKGQAICPGDFLQSVVSHLGRPELGTRIEEASQGLNSKHQSLSLLPEETISLVFDLHIEWRDSGLRPKRFASLFERQATVVEGVLRYSREAIAKVQKPKAKQSIESILRGPGWTDRVRQAQDTIQTTLTEKSQELGQLVADLGPRFKTVPDLAKALSTDKTTLSDARRGVCSVAVLDRLLEKAVKLKAKSATEPAAFMPGSEPASLLGLLLEHGGETSILGVPHVLTPGSFRPIKGFPGKAGIEFTRAILQLARSLLNVLSETENDSNRERVRKALGPEVEELAIAIRTHSFKYPNRLLPTYEAQRETWNRDQEKNKEGK